MFYARNNKNKLFSADVDKLRAVKSAPPREGK